MGIEERGHDYFLQCTDARPDTGGLSGATPAEAVSWGKDRPRQPARLRRLLPGQHDLPASHHRLRADPARPAQAQRSLRPPRRTTRRHQGAVFEKGHGGKNCPPHGHLRRERLRHRRHPGKAPPQSGKARHQHWLRPELVSSRSVLCYRARFQRMRRLQEN